MNTSPAATRLVNLVLDANDLPGLTRWWSAALGWPVVFEAADETALEPPERTPGVPLVLVPVPEPKAEQNRIHLDLVSASADEQRATVERLLALGARPADVGQTGDEPWTVLADPEGNELCVLEPRPHVTGTGPVAFVVVDTPHPEVAGAFWTEAAGWPVAEREDGRVALRAPDGTGPYLEFLLTPGPRRAKHRLHLDLAPHADGDRAAAVARLTGLGAEPADVGQTGEEGWTVLADPDGNEFCVLSPR